MASIAFFAYASAAATPLTTAATVVGGIGAALIDQGVLLPRLFPAPDNEGPKFDETNLQSAAEGVPINRCHGSASRMGGQVIWLGELQKFSALAATSGKGGGYAVSSDQYRIDAAVAFCGNETDGINRLHADGKLLWTDSPDSSVTSTVISAAIQASYCELTQSEFVSFEDDSLAKLQSGVNATISGWPRKSTFTHTNPTGANILFFQGGHSAGGHPTLGQTITLDANGAFGLAGNITNRDSFTIAHGGSVGTVRYWFKSTVNVAGSAFSVAISSEVDGIGGGLQAAVTDNTQVIIEGGNNGIYNVLLSGTNLTTGFPFARLSTSHGQAASAGPSITASQDGVDFDPSKLEGVTIYTGTDFQEPDPIIDAALANGSPPAFRGRTYALLQGLVLTDFGNRLPNMTARCTAADTPTYADAIGSMLSEAGLHSDYYDVDALGDAAPGYYVQGPLETGQVMQPYLVAAGIVAREEDGVLVFYKRESVPTRTIDSDDLGAVVEGGQSEYPGSVSDMDDLDVPNAVSVSFLDQNKDFQSGTVIERAPGVASGTTAQVRLPLALSSAQARDLAQHIVYNNRTNRQRLSITLPPSYLYRDANTALGENERLEVTVFGDDWTILTQRVDTGDDWLIRVEGIREDIGIALFAESEDAGLEVATSAKTKAPPALRLQIMDAALLSDAHANLLGFYYAAGSYQEDKWGPAVLYASSDGGESYKYVTTVYERATMGATQDTLADGPIGIFDRANTVTVELDSGELESVTEAECLKGANRMWIKSSARGEVIGFTTATLVGTRTYELSGLLRGLRDTRDYTASHSDGDAVVLLNQGVHFYETNAAGVGVQRIFKLVPSGGAVADAAEHTERLQGYTMRPFAPVHVEGARDGSDNLTVTAVRRSRRLVDIFAEIGAAGADPSASMTYELDVMSGSTVLRTIAASSLSFAYSAANQTTDGLTPGDPVTVRVYGVSETVGRGNYTEATV